jgi:hypothetical protein
MIILPFLSGYLYLLGGQKWCWYRWGMGLPISLIALIFTHNPLNLLCIPTYYIATSAFPYGEKSWLNFLGEGGKFFVCGLAFGFASIPILGFIGILQGIISGFAFLGIKILDNKDIIKNPWVEFLRGCLGSCLLIVK